MSTLSKYDFLQRIRELDHDRVLTPQMILLMGESLRKFTDAAIIKFIAGQKEHGGDIRERNLEHEIFCEHIDLFWYHAAMSWPKDRAVGRIKKLKKEFYE